jgi:XapX domain-containing protein
MSRIKSDQKIMKEVVLSLLAGRVIGIIFAWLKLPIPAPPPLGLVGAAGLTLGAFCYQWLNQILGK